MMEELDHECDNCGEPIDYGYLCDWCKRIARGLSIEPEELDVRKNTRLIKDRDG